MQWLCYQSSCHQLFIRIKLIKSFRRQYKIPDTTFRSALQSKKDKKKPIKAERYRYKIVGEPEDIENSRNRLVLSGVKVRVKRYNMEKIL